uniref:Uncharacterized protein n=1 Tax=Arundo donax TaxID=35708 RepID=A0A0A8ZPV4_ARUDO
MLNEITAESERKNIFLILEYLK